jgi:hypothetical protein
LPQPAPEWARITGWALVVWAFAWTGIGLVALPDLSPATIRRIDLGGEWMLLPAAIALWTAHYGWRRLATVHGALILGTMIVGAISAALLHPASPEMPPSSLRSIGGTLAFVGSLLALWAPALSSRFLPVTPWIPIPWRRRLSVVLLVLVFTITSGAAVRLAFQRPRYISTATLELPSVDPFMDWIVAWETCTRDFPATTLSLEQDLPLHSSTNGSIQRRLTANAPTPDEALNALNAVLRPWREAPAGDAPRVLEDPTTPIAARSPFRIMIAAVWAILLLGLPALYLRQPHPIPPQRMFHAVLAASCIGIVVDAARRLLT